MRPRGLPEGRWQYRWQAAQDGLLSIAALERLYTSDTPAEPPTFVEDSQRFDLYAASSYGVDLCDWLQDAAVEFG